MNNEHSHLLPNELRSPQCFSINVPAPLQSSEDPPLYLENDSTLRERIGQLIHLASSEEYPLPITSYPRTNLHGHLLLRNAPDAIIKIRQEIVNTFFDAIKTKKDEDIAALIECAVVTPETIGSDGRTPLLAAIKAGNVRTVQQLMDFDANVNAFGIVCGLSPLRWGGSKDDTPSVFRSPLMVAAETGNLVIVKLLVECYGADDALVAPDGELALRLAASNGHREIVKYLPTRRSGGWRRWKTKHRQAVKRIVRAGKGIASFAWVLGFEVPKFFLWYVPKHVIVFPVWKALKWMHTHRDELPERIVRSLKRAGRTLMKVPEVLWLISKGLAESIWEGIKGLPKAVRFAIVWTYTGIKNMGDAVANVFKRFFTFLHTAFAAVANSFHNITLKDIWDGFGSFLHTLFVDGPRKMWRWLCTFEKMTLKMLGAMWGCAGWLLWMLLRALIGIFTYVPMRMWEIIVSVGGSLGSAFREVLIWIDPKRR
jgi:hypothetical protein